MPKGVPYAGRERRRARPSPLWIGLAVLGLGAIAFVTLCPIQFRPRLGDPDLERFAAFLALGGLFALAAGRRVMAATAAVVALAVVLEAAQHLIPGRHGEVSDAAVKALGGDVGVALAQLRWPLQRLAGRLQAAVRAGLARATV